MGAKLTTLWKVFFQKKHIYHLVINSWRTFVLAVSIAAACLPATVAAPRRSAAPAAPLAHPPDRLPEDLAATPLEVTMTAELEQQQSVGGRTVRRLLPAEHVVPGDTVIYTVEARNTGNTALSLPQFVAPIPEHTSYVAETAVGPGADITYSADGGQTFERPENLRVHGAGGALRAAVAADYTHIRWTLRHGLKAHSVVYARFHARLN